MDARDVRELLEDRPDLESALREIRSVDERRESWTFDDVPVDSGAFGELVGEGVVESVDDEYRLVDPGAVERALAGEIEDGTRARDSFDLSLPSVDHTATLALLALLALTVLFRASTYTRVFRDRVVFSGNDPYFYVYVVERALENGWSPGSLPGGMAEGEPLTYVAMVLAAELAGGLGSHRPVLAWLPVVAAVATALALYGFAREVTDDRRVALASVLVLAVLPTHVLRSSLGYVDHHAFDYVWLTVTAWGLVAAFDLDSVDLDRSTVRATGLLATGVAGSVLAWWAATLLLFPLAIATVVAGAIAVRDDEPFLAPGLAAAVGVGLGAVVVALAHLAFGWQETVVVAVPAVLAIGIAGVAGATFAWRRADLPAWSFPATGVAGVTGVALTVSVAAPDAWALVSGRIGRLFSDDAITEMESLFSGSQMGWLFGFGLLLLVVLPAMAWGVYRAASGDRRWLVASTYAWFLLVLAGVQARYAGELSAFAALFGGFALLVLAERVDAAGLPVPLGGDEPALSVPDRDVAVRLGFVVLLVCGLSAVIAPINATDVAVSDGQYEATAFLADHAAEAGHEYPGSYVFSAWTYNRMYNYHVNGESRSYGHAQNNYRAFTFSESPDEALGRARNGPGGGTYLITEPVPGDVAFSAASMQSRLHERFGSRGDGVDGLGHYRALFASDDGDYKAFRVVDGATVRGEADSGSTVTLETEVDIPGASFTYRRQAVAGENGTFVVTVAYPGDYEVEGASGDGVTVHEEAVQNGQNVTVT